MPELPEVETVVRDLRPLLVGRTLVRVARLTTLDLRRPWDPAWADRLSRRNVTAIERRGKWIVVHLEDGSRLVVHLGMTGQFVVHPVAAPRESHTHFVFVLDQGELRFRDIRRFGSIQWMTNADAVTTFFSEQGIGPEPFGLEAAWWREQMVSTRRVLKATLLDQTVVAGVGNIYADEALYHARLHPLRRADDLSDGEAEALRCAVEEVLTRAIERRGSTIRDYIGGSGLAGGFQDEFAVYGREGQPCPRCETGIEMERVAGRSSHYCPRCQPRPEEG